MLVSSVEPDSASTQGPALSQPPAAFWRLIRVVITTALVQVVQGCSSFHSWVPRLWGYVPLKFLHQHLTASSQDGFQVPQRTSPSQGPTAILIGDHCSFISAIKIVNFSRGQGKTWHHTNLRLERILFLLIICTFRNRNLKTLRSVRVIIRK